MSYPDHDTTTTDATACELCAHREATDEYSHARVDNFYARAHLRAVVEDRQAARPLRIEAARKLTHVSYPIATRRAAAVSLVRLTEPGIAGLVRDHFAAEDR